MLSGVLARLRSLWKGTRGDLDAEMRAEFEHHMQLRTLDLVKSGMAPEDAARQAKVEFGGTYNYKEAGRDARGLRWFDALQISWLDVKLGGRMLRRYPWLTAISSVAIGVGIAVGAGTLTVLTMLFDPKLPLDEGDRIVGIRVSTVTTQSAERRILHDFVRWRDEMRTVRELGAFRPVTRNLSAPDGRHEPTRAVAMSASGFRVARVAPVLGRFLMADDERIDAPAVAVLGHELWTNRFAADSGIVGKTVLFSGKAHTIVGVMPPKYAFPVNFTLWVPLRADPLAFKPRTGPTLYVFGRLAPGVTLEEARAELTAVGLATRDTTATGRPIFRANLMPFARSYMELDTRTAELVYRSFQIGATLLLIIICVNVAILVYARTATRQREIAVRTALGASRARVVTQLFGEALVLAAVGAVVGLSILAGVSSIVERISLQAGLDALPFWQSSRVSGSTLAYVVGLAMVAAAIIGVAPALRLTGRRVQASLQRLAGNAASVRMGSTWTMLIIVEVAFTVAIMPVATFFAAQAVKASMTSPGADVSHLLSAKLWLDDDVSEAPGTIGDERAHAARFAAFRDELIRRLRELGAVEAVAFSRAIPGSEGTSTILVDSTLHWVRLGRVSPDWFRVLQVPLIAGRTFSLADADTGATAVVVNRSFVEKELQGRNPLGRRVRRVRWENGQATGTGPWLEIVGVVADFPAYDLAFEWTPAALYQAAVSTSIEGALAISLRGADPAAFATTMRATAERVHPGLQLSEVKPLDDRLREPLLPFKVVGVTLITITLSVLLLSAAAIHALMSVVVTQRRREIAIRMALGADRRRLVMSILAHATGQVGGGVAIGLIMAASFNDFTSGELLVGSGLVTLPAIGLFMLVVGALSALGPARRGLAIQPSTVLKED